MNKSFLIIIGFLGVLLVGFLISQSIHGSASSRATTNTQSAVSSPINFEQLAITMPRAMVFDRHSAFNQLRLYGTHDREVTIFSTVFSREDHVPTLDEYVAGLGDAPESVTQQIVAGQSARLYHTPTSLVGNDGIKEWHAIFFVGNRLYHVRMWALDAEERAEVLKGLNIKR